jgi:hypothetical protein
VAAPRRSLTSLLHKITRYFTLRPRVRAALPPPMIPSSFCTVEAADMPALTCGELRHVVNTRDVSCNAALSLFLRRRPPAA